MTTTDYPTVEKRWNCLTRMVDEFIAVAYSSNLREVPDTFRQFLATLPDAEYALAQAEQCRIKADKNEIGNPTWPGEGFLTPDSTLEIGVERQTGDPWGRRGFRWDVKRRDIGALVRRAEWLIARDRTERADRVYFSADTRAALDVLRKDPRLADYLRTLALAKDFVDRAADEACADCGKRTCDPWTVGGRTVCKRCFNKTA